MEVSDSTDRISVLPDELIHKILSSSDTTQIIQTSLLSNRWRYLWLSMPILDFNFDFWLQKCKLEPLQAKTSAFMEFVDTVLSSRGPSNKVIKFLLNGGTQNLAHLDPSRVSFWLTTCLERCLSQLHLDFWYQYLPQEFRPIVLPSILSPTSGIKVLQLCRVVLPAGNAEGELVLRGRVLKNLTIAACNINHLKTLTISTPLLEKLRLSLAVPRESASRINVKIYTPKLEYLQLSSLSYKKDATVVFSIEEELVSLVTARIVFFQNGSLQYFDGVDGCSQSSIKILSRVYNARTLKLFICTKQVLTDFPVSLERLQYKFPNLRCMTLVDMIQTPCIRAMSKFLASLPSLETLVWHKVEGGESYGAEESGANELDESVSNVSFGGVCSCLKTVVFRNLAGTEFEIKFLRFLLERAFFFGETYYQV